MNIKMPIKFHGSYNVVVRQGDSVSRERCQKLTVRELSETEKARSQTSLEGNESPTHQITFYDFGCKRILDGILKEDLEEKVVFQVKDKEYEFSPQLPPRR